MTSNNPNDAQMSTIGNGNEESKSTLISDNIKIINKVLSRNNGNLKLSRKEKTTIQRSYMKINSLDESDDDSSPAIHSRISRLKESEIKSWFDHVISRLEKLGSTQEWELKGELEDVDIIMFNTCFCFLKNTKSLLIAFHTSFYTELAKFISSIAPKLPCPPVTQSFIYIVNFTAWRYGKDHEKIDLLWKRLESCGILAQFIRCSTMELNYGDNSGTYLFYQTLIKNLTILNKLFKRDQPCGVLIDDILAGRDGSERIDPRVKIHLCTIKKLVHSATKDGKVKTRPCSYCSKFESTAEFQESTLMQCGRCKQAYYCSKECQRKDWKSHKETCTQVDSKAIKLSQLKSNCVSTFLHHNYAIVLKRLIEVMNDTGLPKEELVVDVDFNADESGMIPALRTPPIFRINSLNSYCDDSEIFSRMQKVAGSSTDSEILCVSQSSNSKHICKYQLIEKEQKGQMYSNSTILAAKKAIEEQDYGPLSCIFSDSKVQDLKRCWAFNLAPRNDECH